MTFQELKDAILINSREVKTCDDYHKVMLSMAYGELLEQGLPTGIWAYKSGIITDALLAEFPAFDLNIIGIYNSGSSIIVNPTQPIYVLPGAIVNATVDGNNSCNFYSLGGTLNVTAITNAHAEITAYNQSIVTATLSNNSVGCINLKDDATLTGEINNNAVATIEGRSNSVTTIEVKDDCHATLYGWQHAAINYDLQGSGQVKIIKNQASKIEPIAV